MYVDKPLPELIFSLVISAILIAGIILLIVVYHKTNFHLEKLFTLSIFYIMPCMIFNMVGIALLGAFFVNYTVTEKKVVISIGPIKRKINLTEIVEVRKYNPKTDMVNEHYCPRLSGFVTIQTKRKGINKVVLSPQDPGRFIEEIKKRIQ